MRKLLPKVSNIFAQYPSSQSCGNILLPFLGQPHLKIHLILLFFLYQKKESSKWRKWKYHYILEESKKKQSICVPSPNILGYIQIPTWVNKIKVSCLWEGKENTGIAKKGAGFWPWQKNVDLTKGSQAELYWKWLQKIFDPPPTPPKKGSQHSQKGDYFLRFWNHPGLVYHSGQ